MAPGEVWGAIAHRRNMLAPRPSEGEKLLFRRFSAFIALRNTNFTPFVGRVLAPIGKVLAPSLIHHSHRRCNGVTREHSQKLNSFQILLSRRGRRKSTTHPKSVPHHCQRHSSNADPMIRTCPSRLRRCGNHT